MDRDAARAMGTTDATPFLENADSHWEAATGWNEDSGDLGDAEEFEDGDEALSDYFRLFRVRKLAGRGCSKRANPTTEPAWAVKRGRRRPGDGSGDDER